MKQIITLSTVPQERRIEIVDGRTTFFFFWISAGDEPIVLINPNITKWATGLKNGVMTETGGVTHTGDMRGVQFSDASRIHTVTLDDGEQIRVTLQQKRKTNRGQSHTLTLSPFPPLRRQQVRQTRPRPHP